MELGPDFIPQCWTEGPRQGLAWQGPEKAGPYGLKMTFWRYQPFPEKEVTVRYRLPGQSEWKSLRAGVGRVEIEGKIAVRSPGQMLRLEMETQTWLPAERIAGSPDRRPLGMAFTTLELHPE